MNDDDVWDFYFCQIDGRVASIFFNESIRKRAPIARHETMVAVSVIMRAPRPDGLPDSEEREILTKIADALEAAVTPAVGALYVGRVTHGGSRDLYFYAADANATVAAATRCMADFAAYQFSTRTKHDPDWSVFREFLYPSARDRQWIENRKVCEVLKQRGDPLTEKREVCHWAYFPTASARDAFLKRVSALGFELRDETSPNEDQDDFGASFARIDMASWGEINKVTVDLLELAQEFEGIYDGWESPVVKSSH